MIINSETTWEFTRCQLSYFSQTTEPMWQWRKQFKMAEQRDDGISTPWPLVIPPLVHSSPRIQIILLMVNFICQFHALKHFKDFVKHLEWMSYAIMLLFMVPPPITLHTLSQYSGLSELLSVPQITWPLHTSFPLPDNSLLLNVLPPIHPLVSA